MRLPRTPLRSQLPRKHMPLSYASVLVSKAKPKTDCSLRSSTALCTTDSDEDVARRDKERLLLVLDLNGTLLYRRKNASGRSVANAAVTPRPYLCALLRYCLGPLGDQGANLTHAWPLVDRERVYKKHAPVGSQFWAQNNAKTLFCPPATPIDVLIWSSATSQNVDRMVEAITAEFPTQRLLLQRVWARETLVAQWDMEHKVTTVKDLSIVWDEMNNWSKYLVDRQAFSDPPGYTSRALSQRRLEIYRAARRKGHGQGTFGIGRTRGPDDLFAEAQMRVNDSDALPYGVLQNTPYGPQNTVLLDDSHDKARCQRYNHICIPEYDRRAASDYKMWLANGASLHDVESLDDYLLQFVGVLDALTHVSDVATWIRQGGLATFHAGQSPEERANWLQRGRAALAHAGIPIEP